MTLTVVSGAGVMRANAADAPQPYIENPTQDQLATALESGSLQWTYSVVALPNERFTSHVAVVNDYAILPLYFKDRDGVVLTVDMYAGSTYTQGGNVASLQTTVTGPGTIGWWYGFDTYFSQGESRFGFWVDDALRGVMYTSTGGFYTTYNIPDGTHTIKWELSVDPAAPGFNAPASVGYLNSVTWMPTSSLSRGATVQAINDVRQTLSPSDFRSAHAYNAYANKLTAVVRIVEAGAYDGAKAKITNDLMRQTDDATLNGALGTIVIYLTALQAAR